MTSSQQGNGGPSAWGHRVRWPRQLAAIVAFCLLVAACGSTEQIVGAPSADAEVATAEPIPSGPTVEPVVLSVAERVTSDADPAIAGEAITAFGFDLLAAAREQAAVPNLTVSPTSAAIALAMLDPGTSGEAEEQLRTLLRIEDPAAFHASMSALETSLEARLPDPMEGGQFTARIANAAYLQEGYPFNDEYLEAIGTSYGPVLHEVDFFSDPDAVARTINAFVAEATNDRITDLIPDGALTKDTVLTLVNALYLDATWLRPFDESLTTETTFTMGNGAEVNVDMMADLSESSVKGDGWVGATKSYSGDLSAQFILPDEGRFNEVANNLPAVFATYPSEWTIGDRFGLPRFEIRANLELDSTLQTLGLTAPYGSGGLTGISNDPRLAIHKVIHETYVRMDEAGTEAAAATAVGARLTSGGGPQPTAVILDRPFLFRIIDSVSGATLFIGQVTDPSAGQS